MCQKVLECFYPRMLGDPSLKPCSYGKRDEKSDKSICHAVRRMDDASTYSMIGVRLVISPLVCPIDSLLDWTVAHPGQALPFLICANCRRSATQVAFDFFPDLFPPTSGPRRGPRAVDY